MIRCTYRKEVCDMRSFNISILLLSVLLMGCGSNQSVEIESHDPVLEIEESIITPEVQTEEEPEQSIYSFNYDTSVYDSDITQHSYEGDVLKKKTMYNMGIDEVIGQTITHYYYKDHKIQTQITEAQWLYTDDPPFLISAQAVYEGNLLKYDMEGANLYDIDLLPSMSAFDYTYHSDGTYTIRKDNSQSQFFIDEVFDENGHMIEAKIIDLLTKEEVVTFEKDENGFPIKAEKFLTPLKQKDIDHHKQLGINIDPETAKESVYIEYYPNGKVFREIYGHGLITLYEYGTEEEANNLFRSLYPNAGSYVVVNVDDLNIRSEPSTSSEIRRKAIKGLPYTYLETAEADGYTWYHSDAFGWFASKPGENWVTVVDECPDFRQY